MGGRVSFVLDALQWAAVSVVFAIGLATLVGWMTGREELIRLHSTFAPAQLAASVSLIALALGLILSAHGRRRAARITAAVPMTLGALAVLSTAFNLPPALDRVLASALGAADPDLVESMASPFAIGVICAAAGIFVLSSRESRRFAIGLTIPMVVVSLPVVVGYATAAATLETGDHRAGFAVQSALALLCGALALGALSMAPDERQAPRWMWMPIAVAVLMAAPFILTWERVASDRGAASALPQSVLIIGILAASALGFALAGRSRHELDGEPVPPSTPPSDVAQRALSVAERVEKPDGTRAEPSPGDLLVAAATGRTLDAEKVGDELFRALTLVAPAGIYVADAHGQCLFVNEQWCTLAGLTGVEAVGDGWRQTLHHEDRDRVLRRWDAQSRAIEAFNEEYRFLGFDGRVVWVEDRATALTHGDGRLAGYVGVVVDVSARRQADLAGSEREESWGVAIEAQQIGVFEWDFATNAVTWSPRLHALLGFGPTDYEPSPGSFHTLAHPDDRVRLERAITAHLATGEPLRLVVRLARRSGEFGYFLFAGEAARDQRGRPRRLCGSLVALTEHLTADLLAGLHFKSGAGGPIP